MEYHSEMKGPPDHHRTHQQSQGDDFACEVVTQKNILGQNLSSKISLSQMYWKNLESPKAFKCIPQVPYKGGPSLLQLQFHSGAACKVSFEKICIRKI